MICCRTFKNKTRKDFESFGDWVDFVNQNTAYSKTKSTPYDWIGKCKEIQLPSFHPYWGMYVKINRCNRYLMVKNRLQETKYDSFKFMVYFSKMKEYFEIEIENKKRFKECEGVFNHIGYRFKSPSFNLI